MTRVALDQRGGWESSSMVLGVIHKLPKNVALLKQPLSREPNCTGVPCFLLGSQCPQFCSLDHTPKTTLKPFVSGSFRGHPVTQAQCSTYKLPSDRVRLGLKEKLLY